MGFIPDLHKFEKAVEKMGDEMPMMKEAMIEMVSLMRQTNDSLLKLLAAFEASQEK